LERTVRGVRASPLPLPRPLRRTLGGSDGSGVPRSTLAPLRRPLGRVLRIRGHVPVSTARSRVACLKTAPETVLFDLDRLIQSAALDAALAPGQTTILKDNISWHFPFPGANTTPW